MKKCGHCGKYKDLDLFYKNKRTKDGLAYNCKECNDMFNSVSRNKHSSKTLQHRRNYRNRVTKLFNEWKADKYCIICRETDDSCFDLHHLDSSSKEDHPSVILRKYGWSAFLVEAQKCVVLCANCHRKVHAGKICII